MPYFDDTNLDEDEKNQNQSSVQISGASPSAAPSGSVQQTGPKSNPSLSTGSGFQNLDSYLKTNDAPQFANQVAGKVQSQVDTAKQNQDTAAQAFGNQVQTSNNLPTQEQVNSSVANPTGADARQYQSWENNSYSGPRSLAESQDANNKFWSGTQQAQTQSQLLGTEPGRFTLLDQYYGRPTYNYGQKSLDNLLIQGGNIGDKTQDLQNQAAQLNTQGQNTAKELSNQAAQRANEVQQSAQYARNAIGVDQNGQVITDPNAQGYGAIGQQYTAANSGLAQANADRQAQANDYISQIQADPRNALGFSPTQQLYGANISPFVSSSPLTLDQYLTPEQRTKIQALSQLAGVTDTFASGTPQAATPAYTFDQAGATSAVNQAQRNFNNDLKSTYLNNLKNNNFLSNAFDYDAYQKMDPVDLLSQLKTYYDQQQNGVKLNQLGTDNANLYKTMADKYNISNPTNAVTGRGPMSRGG